MATQHNTITEYTQTPGSLFSQVISVIETVFSLPLDINHYRKSFASKKPILDPASMNLEGMLNEDGTVSIVFHLIKASPSFSVPLIQLWQYLAALNAVKILPPETLSGGMQDIRLTLSISAKQLNYLEQASLVKTLENTKTLSSFIKANDTSCQHPGMEKILEAYAKNPHFRFIKPVPQELLAPELATTAAAFDMVLLSGNPVYLKSSSEAVLECLLSALSTIHWPLGFHYGLLQYPLLFSQILDKVSSAPGIPVIPLWLALKDLTFEPSIFFETINKTAKPVLFISTSKSDNPFPDWLPVYEAPDTLPLNSLVIHYLVQESENTNSSWLPALAEKLVAILRPFENEESRIVRMLPGLCRQALYINAQYPAKLKHHLSGFLFHHFH